VLDEPVGRGGMGEVWKATDQVLRRSVAIKLHDLAVALDPEAAARFRREIETTASLTNPNIVTVFDAGTDKETAFLVMELLPGPTLAQIIEESLPLSVGHVVDYGLQICAGLGAAHAMGVVHRDLKPANLMFAANGTLKIVDFGIARIIMATTTQVHLTATSAVIGTPSYVAPEQAVGGTIDARTDLYALGCVLFALLAGRPPYSGANALETLGQHLHAPVPEIANLRPDLPASLAATITDLLAKNPARRPQSSAETSVRLAASAQPFHSHPTALPTTLLASTQNPAKTAVFSSGSAQAAYHAHKPKRKAAVIVAAALTALLGGTLAVVFESGNKQPNRPTNSTLPATSTSTPTKSPTSSSPQNLTTTTGPPAVPPTAPTTVPTTATTGPTGIAPTTPVSVPTTPPAPPGHTKGPQPGKHDGRGRH
jgi:eukaryotic-like serine/threonine-protein kinase